MAYLHPPGELTVGQDGVQAEHHAGSELKQLQSGEPLLPPQVRLQTVDGGQCIITVPVYGKEERQ